MIKVYRDIGSMDMNMTRQGNDKSLRSRIYGRGHMHCVCVWMFTHVYLCDNMRTRSDWDMFY